MSSSTNSGSCFSQAAKKHYLSQAAISQQISKLEEEVGVRLFDRSKYRPELTEAGKYYYQKIKQLSEEYEKIEKQTRYIQKKNSQKIVVGITGPFENKYLPRIINEYKEGHETHFDVRVYTFEEGKKLLEAGDIDIAFGLSSEFSVNPDISYETIHQSETCIVCSRKNRLSQYKSINPILVKDEPMITLSSQMGRKFYDDFMKEIDELKKADMDEAHMGIASGYEVKTDTDKLLVIGRYVVNTAGSSSTTIKYDTIDKQNKLLITLPSLFKDEAYIDIISENIKAQMKEQMKDENNVYWLEDEMMGDENFSKIDKNQSFYITKDNQLVIAFDKYEVAPGYMGNPEFIIPSELLKDAALIWLQPCVQRMKAELERHLSCWL